MNLRTTAWLRCNGYCERCGIPLGNDWALHHRKLRSRGGRDEISNVVCLHHHCHNLGKQSVHLNVQEATINGFLVASWDDPARVPIRLHDDTLVLCTPDGAYQVLEDGRDAWRDAGDRSSRP